MLLQRETISVIPQELSLASVVTHHSFKLVYLTAKGGLILAKIRHSLLMFTSNFLESAIRRELGVSGLG